MRTLRILSVLLAALTFVSCGTVVHTQQPTNNPPARPYTSLEYINRFAPLAVREMKASGVPASITLAQACLESGFGNSTLATRANNHFGIKCHGWTGATYYYKSEEEVECFRSYASADESYRDHSDFLHRKRYAFLFDLDRDDYKAWAWGLQEAGYATSPTYAAHLIRLIEEYDLARYDNP